MSHDPGDEHRDPAPQLPRTYTSRDQVVADCGPGSWIVYAFDWIVARHGELKHGETITICWPVIS